jgi:hypothetical protein
MRESVITVAYRIVHGNAKQYRYVGAKLYRARKRKDGVYTYRPHAILGPDRRSERLAMLDAKKFCKKMKYGFQPNVRLGTLVNITASRQHFS